MVSIVEKSVKQAQKELNDPFPEGDIEWRVQQSGASNAGKPWAMVISYVTNRAIQQRFDDVFGFMGWEDVYKETPGGMLCGITVHLDNKSVTKWDGAETPRALTEKQINDGKKQTIDPVKTVLSNSEKRAAVKFGVGRYLYNLETAFALCKILDNRRDCSDNGTYMKIKPRGGVEIHAEWFPPPLESWALPHVKSDDLIEKIRQAKDLIVMKGAYITAYKYASSFNRGDLIKKIVEAKDAQKLKLELEGEQESTKEKQKIRVWLERIVNDQIFGAQNESVLRLGKQTISEQLKDKCLESGVDIMELMQVLETYYQNQLNEIKQPRTQK